MKTNFIYGLRAGCGYVMLIAVLLLIEIAIDIMVGRSAGRYFSMPYFTVAVVGFTVSVVCGYLYPAFLKRAVVSYAYKYPDVPKRYVEEICQSKVRCRYCLILGCLCLICSLFYDMDEYRLIVYALMGGGFTLLFQYLKYRKQSKIGEQ